MWRDIRHRLVVAVSVWMMGTVLACGGAPPSSDDPLLDVKAFYQQHGDSIATAPLWVRQEVLRRMTSTTDSLLYYAYLTVLQKSCQMTADLDSVWLLNRQLEAFVCRMPSTPPVADLRSDCYNLRGNLYARMGRPDSAQHYFRLAYDSRLQGTDLTSLPDILMNLADAQCLLGHYDKGAASYRRALSLCDSLELPAIRRTPIYYGLGQVYVHLRDFEQCDRYYDMAGRLFDRMLPYEQYIYLNNRGTSYYYREDYPTAIGYFKQVLRLLEEQPEMRYEWNLSCLNLGDCYLQLQQADSAARQMALCAPFFRQIRSEVALYYLQTQELQLALLHGDVPRARRLLEQAVEPVALPPDMLHIRNQYLQQYFEAIGDYRKAYHFYHENTRLKDSIRNERVRMRTADQVLRYQQDSTLMAQQALLQRSTDELEQMRQMQIFWTILCLLTLLLAVFIALYHMKKRDLMQARNRRQISSLKLENIRNRLSPHFIFNVLNREVAGRKDDDRGELYTLVKLIRSNLALADRLCVSLSEELDFVMTYIDIERNSLGPQFDFRLELAPDVPADRVNLPSMLIQIPVENAVKHALRMKRGSRRLCITVARRDKGYDIRIIDNGGGFRPMTTSTQGTGTGLRVVMQTIQILNQQNREKIEVSVSDVLLSDGEKGCQVAYYLPGEYNFFLQRKSD